LETPTTESAQLSTTTLAFLFFQAVETEDFYETTSLLYRFFYMTPVFFNFRMRFYVGFVLAECSCIAAGLGAYPERSAPRPGNGPTKLDKLKEM
jgi:lysophospholipid acyltransferase 7